MTDRVEEARKKVVTNVGIAFKRGRDYESMETIAAMQSVGEEEKVDESMFADIDSLIAVVRANPFCPACRVHMKLCEKHLNMEIQLEQGRAEQPAAVWHVANCNCKRPVDKHGEVATDCRYTDPRCSPGLLREAELRLEVLNEVEKLAGIADSETEFWEMQACTVGKARADVERLKGER